ncbi:DnaB-like helicase C-terminal domain-containing protein [Maribacter sp. BPC-D8]|uniref:replicative DNA helicase n=1 Tax=Maribacter sp. BPC-D8 TaxID=3053613 RepID=UPI002B465E3D|nr:DnaB-like helicase C-terminal domain-containing protein [Maribacter sp. BPC-D8]WRI31422.1 DnaB-like helicase C-terminal domain-containing protein [Maribacter sp. BPC-D8]
MVILDLILRAKKRIEEISQTENISGIPSGFLDLDKLTSGWQSGDLISIGGRSGMGKTSFALSMSKNIAVDHNIPLAYFSIESSSKVTVNKLISAETGLSIKKLRTGNLETHEWEQLSVKVESLENAPFFIYDTPALSIESLEIKVAELVEEHNIKIIIIDYLQLMTISNKNSIAANREQHISIIVKRLKYIARTNGIVVLVLSQLSRAIETRGGSKRPILIDFRESGAIEDDSDIVGFLYRPEYYRIEEWDDEERTSTHNQGELIIAKNRNGSLQNIRLKFISSIGKFDNLDKSDFFTDYQADGNSFKKNPFAKENLPSADDAFGSSMSSSPDLDEDNDVPF